MHPAVGCCYFCCCCCRSCSAIIMVVLRWSLSNWSPLPCQQGGVHVAYWYDESQLPGVLFLLRGGPDVTRGLVTSPNGDYSGAIPIPSRSPSVGIQHHRQPTLLMATGPLLAQCGCICELPEFSSRQGFRWIHPEGSFHGFSHWLLIPVT